jgi:hypothetical protein
LKMWKIKKMFTFGLITDVTLVTLKGHSHSPWWLVYKMTITIVESMTFVRFYLKNVDFL